MPRCLDASAHPRHGKRIMGCGELTRAAGRANGVGSRRRTGEAAALARASGRRDEPAGGSARPRNQPDADSPSCRSSRGQRPRPSKKPNGITYGVPGTKEPFSAVHRRAGREIGLTGVRRRSSDGGTDTRVICRKSAGRFAAWPRCNPRGAVVGLMRDHRIVCQSVVDSSP